MNRRSSLGNQPSLHLKAWWGVGLLAAIVCGAATAEEFYTLVEPCDLAVVDTDSGSTTVIGSTEMAPEGLAFGPDQTLYTTIDLGPGPEPVSPGCFLHSSANWLATIDPTTAAVTPIGAIGFWDVDAIAFAPDGSLYGIAVPGAELLIIDPTTGAGASLGSIGTWGFLGAMEFLHDGTLVAADMVHGGGELSDLLEVPLTSPPGGVLIGPIGFESIEGMSVASDGRLYGVANTLEELPPMLIEIDPGTGAGTWVQDIDVIGGGFMDGLAAIRSYLVGIDIKPGSYPNCFNLDGRGVVPLAILGSDVFDVTQIDFGTLSFEGLAVRVRGQGRLLCTFEDSDGDGHLDVVCQFEDVEGDWTGGDSVGRVTGRLDDGTWIEGFDSICLVP